MSDELRILSPQIARYDNGSRILEFNSKLQPASVENAYKIHAGTDERYESGSKKSSKIGIKIVAYDANHKSTGFAEANLDVSEVKKLWSVVQRNFYGEVISKTRVHNFNLDSKGRAKVQRIIIKKEKTAPDGKEYKLEWYAEINNGLAVPVKDGVGYDSKTYESVERHYLRISASDFFEMVSQINSFITAWEIWAGSILFTKRVREEAKRKEMKESKNDDVA